MREIREISKERRVNIAEDITRERNATDTKRHM